MRSNEEDERGVNERVKMEERVVKKVSKRVREFRSEAEGVEKSKK